MSDPSDAMLDLYDYEVVVIEPVDSADVEWTLNVIWVRFFGIWPLEQPEPACIKQCDKRHS